MSIVIDNLEKFNKQLENFKGEFLNNELIFHLIINAKTMKSTFFDELYTAFNFINSQKQIRCVILTSNQKHFTTGLDLMDAANVLNSSNEDPGRQAIQNYNLIKLWQGALNQLQQCVVPVIAGIDNLCIGGGIDLISSADIRVCTKNSKFTIKEVDIGLCADIGTTQRLPLICGNDSKLRELMFTGDIFDSETAKQIGLISNIYENKQEMIQNIVQMATRITEKSPVAVWTIKNVMNHQQLQSVEPNLRYQQAINSGMLQTTDIKSAVMAGMQKQKPVFPKL